jgi:methyl-accepting chemotaxis protein
MSDNFWWKAGGSEGGQDEPGQGPRRGEEPKGNGSAAAADTQAHETNGDVDLSNIPLARDASIVRDKAYKIGMALNHTALEMAHVIAAITLTPDAADRLSEARLNGGEQLSSERALQACLDFFQGNAKLSHREEWKDALPPSQDVSKLFNRAQRIALQRAPEHQKVEVNDILKAMTQTELAVRCRPYLLGDATLSIDDVARTVEQLGERTRQANTEGVGIVTDAIDRVRKALESHVDTFKEVVSATDHTRPMGSFQSVRYGDAIVDPIRPPAGSETVKLREIASTVKSLSLGANSDSMALKEVAIAIDNVRATTANLNADMTGLRAALSKVFWLTGALALAALLLVGLVVYKFSM